MAGLVRVGDGRGFLIAANDSKYVVTTAHCLPHLPPAATFAFECERAYADLLAPLGQEPKVWAECVFVDPVADIAVLGQPDNQAMVEEADAFDALIEKLTPFAVADFAGQPSPDDLAFYASHIDDPGAYAMMTGSVELIAGFECGAQALRRGPLWITDQADRIAGGMSGSPILQNGAAVGIAVTNNGPHPRLAAHLPAWLAADLIRT